MHAWRHQARTRTHAHTEGQNPLLPLAHKRGFFSLEQTAGSGAFFVVHKPQMTKDPETKRPGETARDLVPLLFGCPT